jgi:hypothetical protein
MRARAQSVVPLHARHTPQPPPKLQLSIDADHEYALDHVVPIPLLDWVSYSNVIRVCNSTRTFTFKKNIWFWTSSCDKQFLSVRKCSIVLRVQVLIGKLPDTFCFRDDTNMKVDFNALLSTLATCYYSNKRNTFSLLKCVQTLALTNGCFLARSPQNKHDKFPRAPEARAKKICPI